MQETVDESIFLAEASFILAIMMIKISMLLWNQQRIMQLLNRVCVFTIQTDAQAAFFNEKIENFIKFVITFLYATIIATVGCSVFPFLGSDKSLFMDFAFPLNSKNSEIGFWMAHIFFVTESVLSFLSIAFSVIIWYLLLHCSLRYEILGSSIKNLGRTSITNKMKLSEAAKQNIFCKDLVAAIKDHHHLREYVCPVHSIVDLCSKKLWS